MERFFSLFLCSECLRLNQHVRSSELSPRRGWTEGRRRMRKEEGSFLSFSRRVQKRRARINAKSKIHVWSRVNLIPSFNWTGLVILVFWYFNGFVYLWGFLKGISREGIFRNRNMLKFLVLYVEFFNIEFFNLLFQRERRIGAYGSLFVSYLWISLNFSRVIYRICQASLPILPSERELTVICIIFSNFLKFFSMNNHYF